MARRSRDYLLQQLLCFIELIEKTVVVCAIDLKGNIVRCSLQCLCKPLSGFRLLSKLSVRGSDQIKDDRVAVRMFDGLRKRGVCAPGLTGADEEICQLRPRGAVIGL